MQITEVTASWSETCSLGNYSNVRPSLTLKATIGPEEEDAQLAIWALTEACKRHVQEQVDQALEAEGEPAKYSSEPRFDVHTANYTPRMVVIVPAGTERLPHCWLHKSNLRLAHARQVATHYYKDDYVFFDCSAGDVQAVVDALNAADAEREAQREAQRRERTEAARTALEVDDDEYDRIDDDEEG